MMKEHFANNFAIGIVDRDKNELDYLNEFNLVWLQTSKMNPIFSAIARLKGVTEEK